MFDRTSSMDDLGGAWGKSAEAVSGLFPSGAERS
jgi:hypothetical protein